MSYKFTFRRRSSSVAGRLPSKVVFRQRSSSVKGCLPSKVVFRQRSSSIKGCLPSKVIFRQRSSSVAPKNGVEFRQKSIGAVRCSLATLNKDWRCHSMSMKPTGTNGQTDRQMDGKDLVLIQADALTKKENSDF